MKLTDRETGFLNLILRSPDAGEGWRKVSQVVWRLVDEFTRPELIETEADNSGGRVRLSPRGAVVVNYI